MPLHHLARAITNTDELASIALAADPTGLAYDHVADALYVADGTTGAVLRVDGDNVCLVAPNDEAALHVSGRHAAGLAVTPYGTLFATRVVGTGGATVVRIDPGAEPEVFDRLAPAAWRHGVAYDPRDHALYATEYVTSRFGAHDGSVIAIDLVTGEPSTVIDGFLMPSGIVKIGSTLVVADARQRAVFRVDLVAGRAVRRLQIVADIGRPDSLCPLTHDSVLVTSFDAETGRGHVRRLWLDGRTQGIAHGPWEPGGITTDGERVFVAARGASKILVFALPRPSSELIY